MKKLGKKIHNGMETIEAYWCVCSYCGNCACSYSSCGDTTVMVNILQNNRNDVSTGAYLTNTYNS
ncbi:CLI_3235 family bacteriocin precursor [Ruminiclostridium papyrosolvens]|uniref:Bacteriocin n=1 Tax=Ruminiclostridium papyrosolvens C7 TaxID=1330534 RepID=U4QWN9_9FIRM|nr:CLI_3235 family bacteriocin precursor [Ruminiclostridium papyrosolvens]EPR07706.1 hypothetical protein L323_19445 [Ruminiclostridium papyrosolvens C7]